MPEEKRTPCQAEEELGDVAQSNGDLYDMSADSLLTELEVKLDAMTDRSYDADVVDAYLAALDEKVPLQEQFDTDKSWKSFRSQHVILFEENTLLELDRAISAAHKRRFRKVLPRIIAAAAVIGILNMFCAQAAGMNVFGAIGHWTEETFQFFLHLPHPLIRVNMKERFLA